MAVRDIESSTAKLIIKPRKVTDIWLPSSWCIEPSKRIYGPRKDLCFGGRFMRGGIFRKMRTFMHMFLVPDNLLVSNFGF